MYFFDCSYIISSLNPINPDLKRGRENEIQLHREKTQKIHKKKIKKERPKK